MLTDEEIKALADGTQTAEPGRDGYILPFSFARAIEAAVLAKLAQGVSVEPVVYRFTENRGSGRTAFSYYSPEEVGTAYRDNCLEITRLYDSTAIAAARVAAIEESASVSEDTVTALCGLPDVDRLIRLGDDIASNIRALKEAT